MVLKHPKSESEPLYTRRVGDQHLFRYHIWSPPTHYAIVMVTADLNTLPISVVYFAGEGSICFFCHHIWSAPTHYTVVMANAYLNTLPTSVMYFTGERVAHTFSAMWRIGALSNTFRAKRTKQKRQAKARMASNAHDDFRVFHRKFAAYLRNEGPRPV